MTNWADEQASDLKAVSPKFRSQFTAFALLQARRRGLSEAASWHRKQASLMQDIITECDRGRITSEGVRDKAIIYVAQHEASAIQIERL